MSFPVPVEYGLNDTKDNTIVKYNNGTEWEGLPDPGCFSQENINKFANRWASGNLGNKVTLSGRLVTSYSFASHPFKIVFCNNTENIDGSYLFAYSRRSENAIYVIPFSNLNAQNIFRYASAYIIDLGTNKLPTFTFSNCSVSKIVLRNKNIVQLLGINAFSETKFQAGGSGGEIYIPKELYDHLGDGSALDYKAAANWSTIDGYGTITWRQIEGSEYEFNYADGTPIGSV